MGNHELGHMKSNAKSPTPWFTLNKDLLNWQSHLKVEFDLIFGIWGIMAILKKLGPNTLDYGWETRRVIENFMFYIK